VLRTGTPTTRSAAALLRGTFVVWLLLGPPLRDAAPDPTAPLAQWKRYGDFATEDGCRAGLALMQRMTGDGKYGWERRYWDELARCVPPPAE
jgi:hypothetical protein